MSMRNLLLALAVPFTAAVAGTPPSVRTLGTVDVPNHRIEIVDWYAPGRLLVGTDSHWKTLAIFRVDSFDPPVLVPLHEPPEAPEDVVPLFTGEPTSVAVHPQHPVALVTTLGWHGRERGALQFVDLRAGHEGERMGWLATGFHPDSVALSPDGRWAVVANEGEGDPTTPGTVTVVDLSGLNLGHWITNGALPTWDVPLTCRALETSSGDLEPEYIAISSDSRWAAVSLQENDAVAFISLHETPPRLAGAFGLSYGAQPDGLAWRPEPGTNRYLLAAAEEGLFDFHGRVLGHALSLWSVQPDGGQDTARELSRVDLSALIAPGKKRKRIDPESVKLTTWGARTLALVTSERRDCVAILDVTDPRQPTPCGQLKTGTAPEGLRLIPDGQNLYVITGDEGDYDGPGEITIGVIPAP